MRLTRAVLTAGSWWMMLALGRAAITYLGYALLYHAVSHTRGGPRPQLRLALAITIAVFGGAVVATAAGRLRIEYWALRRVPERPAMARARMLNRLTALWAVLPALTMLARIIALVEHVAHVPRVLEIAWLVVVPGWALGVFVLSSPRRPVLYADEGRRIRRTAASVVQALVLLRLLSWRPLPVRCLVGGLGYWAGQLVVVWAALRGFGVHIGYGAFLLGCATGYASTLLQLRVGGVAGVDAASI